MKNILTLNSISPVINDIFNENYNVSADAKNPDGIILRSFKMHDYTLDANTIAIARAGAGVNNIPTDEYAKQGVVVFNTPGANANAVTELVISALLLGSRKIVDSIKWVDTLKGKGDEIPKLAEKGKSNFVGPEIYGKKLGIIGLGAIGAKVANAALGLGMDVIGYDPFLSVENALHISRHISKVNNLDELLAVCDYITIHIPLLADNKESFNKDMFAKMKDGVVFINCARGELVKNSDVIEAVKSGKIARYISDFAAEELIGVENIICTPHLGASTPEAEDNCAVMAANQLVDYLENGNIVNSVNYPTCFSPKVAEHRVTVNHLNQQNMIAQISAVFSKRNMNIDNFLNKNKGNYAYTILDSNKEITEEMVKEISEIDGVLRVRIVY